MGKRLTKIYTRTGDGGETGLGDGSRVPKTHARVGAMGDIDELNAHLGLVSEHLKSTAGERTHGLSPIVCNIESSTWAERYQSLVSSSSMIIHRIETELDQMNSELAPLENFIIPGGLC